MSITTPYVFHTSSEVESGEKKRAEDDSLALEDDESSEKKASDSSSATPVSAATTSTTTTTAGGTMDTKDDQTSKVSSNYSPNTVIMFDWDDTLLASSFLSARGYRVDGDEGLTDSGDASQLRAQEQCVCALLKLALSYGTVNIVTNAETGWVELSAQKFMPAVLPLLANVTVLSARSTFEPAHPEAPLKWKYYAFHERLRSVFGETCMESRAAEADIAAAASLGLPSDMKKNIVSFGDSHVEREAIRAVTRGVPGWRCKSVKFAERPTVEQLRRQLELVTNCFHYIATHHADLDLQLTVTLHQSPSSATPSATV